MILFGICYISKKLREERRMKNGTENGQQMTGCICEVGDMKESRIKINQIVSKLMDYLDAQTEYNRLMIDDYKKMEKK